MFFSEFAKLLTRCRFPDAALVKIKFETEDGIELVVQNVRNEIGAEPSITVVMASMRDIQFNDHSRFAPPGYRIVKNAKGDTIQVGYLLNYLTKVRERFGDTCIYARDVCWGAVALNRRHDDEVEMAHEQAACEKPPEGS